VALIISAMAALSIIFFGGGIISQMLHSYRDWEAEGETEGTPKLPEISVKACLAALTDVPYGIYGIAIMVGLLGIIASYLLFRGRSNQKLFDPERNLTYSEKGIYGTSGFMTEEECKEILEIVPQSHIGKGIILGELNGKLVCLPEKTRLNKHVALYGASGSMKSRTIRNMIFQCVRRGDSMVLTDPKSELYCDMAEYLRRNGYTVRVFNLVDPEYSDSWDCLGEVGGDEIMAQVFADVVMKNTGDGKGDRFWDNGESNLLKALILYVTNLYAPEQQSFAEVYRLIVSKSVDELSSLFRKLPYDHPAKAPFSIFKQASDTVQSGIIIGLGSRLQVFQSALIKEITSHSEIDLELLGKKKCAYFCITSDQDSTFEFLSSLFFSFLFIKLVRYADKHGKNGKLPVAVNIIADEWANVGTVPDFFRKISTIRSRDINMLGLAFQNIAQLQNRYPDNQWQEILGNCDTHLFLGCTDDATAELVSRRSGIASVQVSSQSKRLGTMRLTDYVPEFRETQSVGRRFLLNPDEVLRLPIDEAFVIIRGQKILKVKKFDYTKHPEYRKLVPCKITDHVPEWRKNNAVSAQYSIEEPTAAEKKRRKQEDSILKL